MPQITAGFALCGSFCTFSKVIPQVEKLAADDIQIVPIMSETASGLDTRFGNAADFIARLEEISQREVIRTIKQAEPIGPKKLLDILVIAPCTGNTLAKLAAGVADSAVTTKAPPSEEEQDASTCGEIKCDMEHSE